MKIYIAARFSKRHIANDMANKLKKMGHTFSCRWIKPDSDHVAPAGLSEQAADSERERFAIEDMEDIQNCDWVISLMEEPRNNSRGGRHVEFGYALALGKRLTVIGPRETVFHHHPKVEHFDSISHFLSREMELHLEFLTGVAEKAHKNSMRFMKVLDFPGPFCLYDETVDTAEQFIALIDKAIQADPNFCKSEIDL